jgi:hypothetical protein
MGTPVVTLPGQFLRGRLTLAMYRRLLEAEGDGKGGGEGGGRGGRGGRGGNLTAAAMGSGVGSGGGGGTEGGMGGERGDQGSSQADGDVASNSNREGDGDDSGDSGDGNDGGDGASSSTKPVSVSELVVSSAEEYVRVTLRLGRDRGYRARMGRAIRGSSDALFEDATAVTEWERFLSAVGRKGEGGGGGGAL